MKLSFLAVLCSLILVASAEAQIVPIARDSRVSVSGNTIDFGQIREVDSTTSFDDYNSSVFGGLASQESSFSAYQIEAFTFAGAGGQATGFSDSLNSRFSLQFDVFTDTEFRLDGTLTESDSNIDFGFGFGGGTTVSLQGPATDLVYTSDPDPAVDIVFDFSGSLEPGRYTLAVSSLTGSVMDGRIGTGSSSGLISFSVAVPEPSSFSFVLVLGALTGAIRRRKSR